MRNAGVYVGGSSLGCCLGSAPSFSAGFELEIKLAKFWEGAT